MGVTVMRPRRQRGMALIIVLMLFAILAAVATEVMFRQDRFRTRADNLLQWDKRYQYAMAVEVVATQGLIDDLEDDKRNNAMVDDCVEEQWAVELPATPYEDAILSASVQDLQGRFNLNWLGTASGPGFERNEENRERLRRLLEQVLPEPNKASLLSNEMADWIDTNNIVDNVEGAEDTEYRSRRTPNMAVAHETELRALRSFTVEDLFPDMMMWGLFTALPSGSKLNVNTAPQPVLDAVLGTMAGNDAAEAVMALREEGPIVNVDDVMALAPFTSLDDKQKQNLAGMLTVGSEYFQIMVDVEVDGQVSRLVSRLRRSSQGGPDGTRVFSRQVTPLLSPLEPACNPFYNAENESNNTVELNPNG